MRLIIKFFFQLYILWGRFIRFFQVRSNNYKINRQCIIREFAILHTTDKRWQKLLSMMKYRPDPPWQLWDAVTDPWTSLIKGKDDCDGYAAIASKVFGNVLKYKDKTFLFDRLYFAFYRTPDNKYKGHCIASWKSVIEGKYLIVSTKNLNLYNTFEEAVKKSFNGRIIYAVACTISEGIDFNMWIDKVYKGTEFLRAGRRDD